MQLPANLRGWITDPQGANAYPIVTYTWLLCYKKYKDAQKLAALKSVIEYSLTKDKRSALNSATSRSPLTSWQQTRRRSNRFHDPRRDWGGVRRNHLHA